MRRSWNPPRHGPRTVPGINAVWRLLRPFTAHNGTYALPVTVPRYLQSMSCVEVPESVKRLLEELSDGQEMPANVLNHHAVTLAAANGWVYQHQGLVGLTGAGAYHAGKERRGGMLRYATG